MEVFAGLDVGTNGVRVVVVDEKLKVKYEKSLEYETKTPKEGWAEQDPEEIYNACLTIFNNLVEIFKKDDIYITFSSVMHSIMAVNNQGNSLTPLIIWADTRARKECEWLKKEYGNKLFYDRTSCPLHSTYWPAKILWLKKELGIINDIKYISIKEYIMYKLINKWQVDYGLASTSGIFNPQEGDYDLDILNILGVKKENFAKLVPNSKKFTFKIKGKPITGIMGATDGVLANLGVGGINDKDIVLTVGTSSAVRATIKKQVLDPKKRVWSYILDQDHYVIGEASNGAGLLIKWLAKLFNLADEKKMIADTIQEIPYQTNDIIIIPTFMGERGPNYNEDLRACIYGLSLNHTRKDIIIALYESIAFFLKMLFEDVKKVKEDKVENIIMTGNLGLSSTFIQLMSYLLGEISYLPGHNENTAIGAAMMAIKETKNIDYNYLINYLPGRKTIKSNNNSNYKKYLKEKYKRFLRIYQELSNNKNIR